MRICLVGGIFGKSSEYRAVVTKTPETILAAGLRARGHEVVEHAHRRPFEFQGVDVVHAHHLAAGAVAAAAERPPVRLAFTGHWLTHPEWSKRNAMRYVIARSGAVVALSDTEARWQRETYRDVSVRQHVIPNGVDPSTFRFHAPPESRERWRLLYVGQLSRFKGVEFLLRALALVQDALGVELDLVYQVDTEEGALRQEAGRLGLRGIHFLGARTASELTDVYANSHLLVLPSTGEALPSVISEALMVGRPVVGTDVGAVREQVADFGAVVAPRDPPALASAIGRVLNDYDRYAREAHLVSERAVARYSVSSMIDGHERMYERLAELPPPGRAASERLLDGAIRALVRSRPER